MGTLGDRFGRKRALQAGLALFGGASLAVLFVETRHAADRRPRRHGRRRRADHAGDAVDHHERLPARGARQGDRHLGRHGRDRHRPRPALRRPAARVLRLASVFLVNVPVALDRLRWPACASCPDSAIPTPAASTSSARCSRSPRWSPSSTRVIEAPERGWLDPPSWALRRALVLGAAFVRLGAAHARRRCSTSSLFRNPRFSIALGWRSASRSSRCSASIFALTQFLQFAKGYSRAGGRRGDGAARLRPRARRARSAQARRALGTTRVVAAGLLGLGAMLATTLLWTRDMPYWPIGLWFFGVALSMGWVMGPATDSVMGAVPGGEGGRRLGDERRHPPGRPARSAPP